MDDLKQYVRGRLPLAGVSPPDAEQIVDEIAQHLAELRQELESGGAAPDEIAAALDAELRDGARTARQMSRSRFPAPQSPPRGAFWRTLPLDARQAARSLLRRPGFLLLAVSIMAVAIGATTAVYSVVRAALLRPLPYPRAEQIVRLGTATEDGGVSNVGYATFVDWRSQARSFGSLALIRSWLPTLMAGGDAERLTGVRVSASYFSMLGVRPAMGRDFAPSEDTPGDRYVVIISDALWRRSFDADPAVVGRSVQLDGVEYRVIGVMPGDLEPLVERELYRAGDIWAPLGYDTTLPSACRTCQHLRALGRLRDGVDVSQALAELETIQARLRRQFPSEYQDLPAAVVPFAAGMRAPVRPLLVVLLAASGLMLLVACANVSALLLVQATARQREIALRAALGASRERIARQLLVESAVVALAAGVLGVAAAFALRNTLVTLAPGTIPRLDRAAIDWHVVLFAAGAAAASALLAGTFPALRAAAPNLVTLLQAGGRNVAGGGHHARRALVAAQLAVTLVLLTGAGLMARTMFELARVHPGFDASDLLTFEASFVGPDYAEDPRVETLTNDMLDKIRSIPGVRAAAISSQFPLAGNMDQWGFYIEGRSASPDEVPDVERYGVSPDYLRVMRIPLLAGRFITDADRRDGEQVVVISEAAARRLWPGQNPIGARVKVGDPQGPTWRRVVGVVGDVRHYDLDSPPPMAVYTPNSQLTNSFLAFVIRTAAPADQLMPSLRSAVWQIARDVPVYNVSDARAIVSRALAPRRFATALLAAFAGAAVLLAGVGLYGVIAFAVAERTREFGVRVAFGATRRDVVRVVARAAVAPLAVGIAVGILASALAAQGLRALLFSVVPTDVLTYAGAAGFLILVAALAHLAPLRRALSVDPATALRE